MKIQISLSSTVEEKLQSLMLRLAKDKKNIKSVELSKWTTSHALRVFEKDPDNWSVGRAMFAIGWKHVPGRGSEYVSYMTRANGTFMVRIHETPGSRYIIPESRDWSE